MKKEEANLNEQLVKAGKKDNLYLVYFGIGFLLFGFIGVFDIISNFLAPDTEISYFNLVIGIIFSIVALICLIYIIIFLFIPKIILEIDFKNNQIVIHKAFKKTKIINFKEIYFLKSGENTFTNYLFKYGTLRIFTHIGETIRVPFLTNSKILKESLVFFLKLTDKTLYPTSKFKLFFIRIYHYSLAFVMNFIHYKKPKKFDKYEEIANALSKKKVKKVLLVESKTINRNSLDKELKEALNNKKIQFEIFTDVKPNPTCQNVLEGKKVYKENNCDAIIAIGGGSVLDASKGIAISINTKKDLIKYKGLFKVHHKLPPLVAIPTTCGTGSETTFVSVLTDEKENVKFEIISNNITPKYVILDENLIRDLPLHFVGSTSMDALTHALESYINISRTKKSKKQSLQAIKLIKDNLLPVVNDEYNMTYKKNLLEASFIAGQAFNRGLVGPIHALSHALGGKYNLEHGYLNSILLPRFLRVYLFFVYKDLAKISRYANISNTNNDHIDALKLINYIEYVNDAFKFSPTIKELKKEDIIELSKKAYKESRLLYPSKYFVNLEMYQDILISLLQQ